MPSDFRSILKELKDAGVDFYFIDPESELTGENLLEHRASRLAHLIQQQPEAQALIYGVFDGDDGPLFSKRDLRLWNGRLSNSVVSATLGRHVDAKKVATIIEVDQYVWSFQARLMRMHNLHQFINRHTILSSFGMSLKNSVLDRLPIYSWAREHYYEAYDFIIYRKSNDGGDDPNFFEQPKPSNSKALKPKSHKGPRPRAKVTMAGLAGLGLGIPSLFPISAMIIGAMAIDLGATERGSGGGAGRLGRELADGVADILQHRSTSVNLNNVFDSRILPRSFSRHVAGSVRLQEGQATPDEILDEAWGLAFGEAFRSRLNERLGYKAIELHPLERPVTWALATGVGEGVQLVDREAVFVPVEKAFEEGAGEKLTPEGLVKKTREKVGKLSPIVYLTKTESLRDEIQQQLPRYGNSIAMVASQAFHPGTAPGQEVLELAALKETLKGNEYLRVREVLEGVNRVAFVETPSLEIVPDTAEDSLFWKPDIIWLGEILKQLQFAPVLPWGEWQKVKQLRFYALQA